MALTASVAGAITTEKNTIGGTDFNESNSATSATVVSIAGNAAAVAAGSSRRTESGNNGSESALTIVEKVVAFVKQEYSLVTVLRQHGIQLNRAASGYLVANCPFPNHTDSSPSFKIKTSNPDVYLCYGCTAKGDVLHFIRDYHRLNTVSEAVKYLTGRSVRDIWLEIKAGSQPKAPPANEFGTDLEIIKPVQSRRASENELANATDVYIALLALLGLDEVHQRQLAQRGITLNEALLLGYRSIPVDRNQRIKICKQLRQCGYDLKNVPGFFRLPPRQYSKGTWCFGGDKWGFRDIKGEAEGEVYQVTGLFIPTRDLEGRIRRLKIRNDAPGEQIPEALRTRFPERYMAFSSTSREDGASAGAWVHVARPIYQNSKKETQVLWITEGEIKADISALYLGETTLGMPGVGQCPHLALEIALEGGFKEICVAMDAEEKPHVKLAIAKLVKLAKENNLEVSVAVWDGNQGKGLDDLLVTGGAPEVITPEFWWKRLSGEHKRYVLDRIDGRGATRGETSENAK